MSLQLVMPGSPPPPDEALSQFDTPGKIASKMVAWAGVERGMRVLEPSAGLGALALPMRAASADVRCIELSPSRTEWLRRAGLTVTQADFLQVPSSDSHDLALMNPPYENGQDTNHVLHALKFAPRVVACLQLGTLDGVDRYERIWTKHGLRRLAVLVRRFKAPGTTMGGSRPFAIFEIIRNERQVSTAIEWWP